MTDFLIAWYPWIKTLHVISVIAWMAGMFYLPRLFVYHVEAVEAGSATDKLFQTMERRLLRAIINPAMIATWVFGLILMFGFIDWRSAPWLHAKLVLVVLMSGFHGMLSKWRKDFAADANSRSARFYRIANEVPTLLLIFIVILAVAKPF
jgi:putative membrane protein